MRQSKSSLLFVSVLLVILVICVTTFIVIDSTCRLQTKLRKLEADFSALDRMKAGESEFIIYYFILFEMHIDIDIQNIHVCAQHYHEHKD